MDPSSVNRGRHAVVIGASIGGILAARVLSDYFDKVTLLEKDPLPMKPEARKGVPQAHHAHALLGKGLEILEQLFPNITQILVQKTAVLVDVGESVRVFGAGDYYVRHQNGLKTLGVSRPTLECTLREKLIDISNIQIWDHCKVGGWLTDPQGNQIQGVRFKRKDANQAENLSADLVVDASGRASRTPIWLEALGYTTPDEETTKLNIGYASRIYQILDGQDLPDAIVIPCRFPATRGGVLARQENRRLIVSLAGYFGDHPTQNEAEFNAFAASLPKPEIADTIKKSKPLSDISTLHYPTNFRRHYERLQRFPKGLLVFGDAISSLNPIYGQGITARALEALVLKECLSDGIDRLSFRYFRKASQTLDPLWSTAAWDDLKYPQTEKGQSFITRLISPYIDQLQRTAWKDPYVAKELLTVTNLMKPPRALISPSLLLRILLKTLRSLFQKTEEKRSV